ncbi:cupin domain-containing protein [Marinobacter sp.]|uniref:cupin domain-containing protein n=1 Tax=Marinobacter sp. TaxID=50741 RepID=UPI0034A0A97A
MHGGGGTETRLVCGFLGSDLPRNRLIASLPRVFKLSLPEAASGRWIESSLRFAAEELTLRNTDSVNLLASAARQEGSVSHEARMLTCSGRSSPMTSSYSATIHQPQRAPAVSACSICSPRPSIARRMAAS